MDGVASSAVDSWVAGNKLAVVDHNGPDVDEHEEANICDLLEWEDEWEDVVWNRLRKAIEWVEGVRCEWRWHNPFVVWLVESLVDQRVVQTAVDQVDEAVGEKQEERELHNVVPSSWTLFGLVVELGVAAHFGDEADGGKERHNWHGSVGLGHFQPNLVLEELWVSKGGVVENEIV